MRSIKERLVHSILFEIGGLVIVTPLATWLTGHGFGEMGILAFAVSTFAMIWNFVWNKLFDRWVPTRRRTLVQRVAQTFGFELGILVITLPVVAWWLDIGLVEAFWLDLGFMLFFMFYALVYNTSFDRVVSRRLEREAR
ncbi:PACE efflux transporter [Pistricoccus aurantiacus]|uniref:PACE efflux transporter n=1 Tax=Pistricoccus aurantiacus TaxID=1883414 RepID=A0A5B8SVY1_9GAMM|nr:PACE efflux transporter [Pistricoccus aurantiacus]QEA38918.1 PACE efflux transporter [Pistricoccus aurantiacus]